MKVTKTKKASVTSKRIKIDQDEEPKVKPAILNRSGKKLTSFKDLATEDKSTRPSKSNNKDISSADMYSKGVDLFDKTMKLTKKSEIISSLTELKDVIVALTSSLAEEGQGKLSSKSSSIMRNTVQLLRQLDQKMITSPEDFKSKLKTLQNSFGMLSITQSKSGGVESKLEEKERELNSIEGLNITPVKVSLMENQPIKLIKAPIILLLKSYNKTTTALAKALGGKFNTATSMMFIPEAKFVVINKNEVDERSIKSTISGIWKQLFPTNPPVPIYNLSKSTQKYMAVMCVSHSYVRQVSDMLDYVIQHNIYLE